MIRIELPPDGIPSWLVFVGLVYAVLWIWSLAAVLSDQREGKDVEKLTWVVVLIVLPVLGLILYAFLGPGAQADMVASAKRKPWEPVAPSESPQSKE